MTNNTLTTIADHGEPMILNTGARLRRTGLDFEREPSLQEWTETADVVFGMHDMATWCQLDLIRVGRRLFGDEVVSREMRQRRVVQQQIAELFRLEPIVERRADLTQEHHLVVAKLDEVDQKRWLETAKVNDLSPRDLRASIRANEVVKVQGATVNSKQMRVTGTETCLSMVVRFDAWFLKSREDVKQWTPELVEKVWEEFGKVWEFRQMLLQRKVETGGTME